MRLFYGAKFFLFLESWSSEAERLRHEFIHMLSKTQLVVLILFSFTLSSCEEKESKIKNRIIPPPPEMSFEVKCEEQKRKAYLLLKKGYVRIIFKDSFRNATGTQLLSEVLEKEFKLDYSRIYDTMLDKHCMIPIMDSVIELRYGKNGKDSIINLAYKLADSLYNEKVRKGELEPRDFYQ